MRHRYSYILILTLSLLFACSNEESQNFVPAGGTGEANFEFRVDESLNSSRAVEVDIPSTITLNILPDDITTGTEKSYTLTSGSGTFKRKAILEPGTYNCEAYDRKSVELALNSSERGEAWYYASLADDEHFAIETEKTTNVNVTLKIANSAITLNKSGEFTDEEIFSVDKVALYTADNTNRKLTYELMDGSEYGWYKANQSIMVQVYFTYKGQKYYKILDINEKTIAGNNHIITLKPSLGGIGNISIQLDNSLSVVYEVVILNVDGSVAVGAATGIFRVGVDGEIEKEDGGIEFNPEE